MQISFRTDSYIEVSINWSGDLTIGSNGKAFIFSKDESDLKKAHEMKNMFPAYFSYDFYTECGVNKVMIRFSEGTVVTIK